MKRAILLILLLATPLWSATYYVSGSGSNTSPYDTWAKAALLPSTAVTAGNSDVGGEGPHTMYIADGTYDDTLGLTDADWTGGTIVGSGRTTTIISRIANHTIIGGANADALTISALRVVANGAFNALTKADGADDWLFRDVDFVSAADNSNFLILSSGDTTNFMRCRFFGGSGASASLRFIGDSDGFFAYCLIGIAGSYHYTEELKFEGTSSYNIYNTVSFGLIWGTSTGTFNIRNCTLQAGCHAATPTILVMASGATVTATNNFICCGPWAQGTNWVSGIDTDTDNDYTNAAPKFLSYPRTGYILPCIDDTTSLAYAQSVAAVLDSYGVEGTYFLQVSGAADNAAALRTMITDGVLEVAAHGYSHTDQTYTHAIACTYSGADTNPTVAFTVAGVLQFRTTEHNDEFDLDTTSASYDTLTEVVLADQKNWTIGFSSSDGQDTSHLSGHCLSSSLAVQAATAAPCDVDFDRSGIGSGFFKNELSDAKALLATAINAAGNVTDPQTGTTYSCNTMSTPYDTQDATARTAAADSAFWLCRASLDSPAWPAGVSYVTDVNMMSVCVVLNTYVDGSDEATTRLWARAIGASAVANGGVYPVLAHNTSQLSTDQWGWCLDEWQEFGDNLIITSHQLFAQTVRTSGDWTDDGDGTYSRTWTDSSDYHLLSTSPCIDAGTNLGATYDADYDGKDQDLYGAGWEIGAYVYPTAKGYTGRSGGKQELSGGKQ